MDVDTSSYPRAAPVAQQNPLDTIGKLQEMQQRSIGIDLRKLELVNQKWDYASRYLGSYINKPDLSPDDLISAHRHLMEQGIQTPEQFAQEVSRIPTLATVKRKNPNATPEQQQQILSQQLQNQTKYDLLKHASTMEQLNGAYGSNPRIQPTGGGFQAVHDYNGQTVPTGPVVPEGMPRTTPGYVEGKNGQPGYEAPIGVNQPNSPGLPIAGSPSNVGAPQQRLPVQANPPGSPANPRPVPTMVAPPMKRPPGVPQVGEAGSNAERVGVGHAQFEQPRAGSPPFGSKGAAEAPALASGAMLARDRDAAANYQRRVFPLKQAIPALEQLGTKGTGPGTETVNLIKSFILSNMPGVKEDDFKGLSDIKAFDKANKYLTDYVNQNGNTGTNDKLAAAFAGNPSVHISNAAAQDVAKSALALENMKQAKTALWERAGLQPDQYASWSSKWENENDPRAFAVPLMSQDKRDKMIKSMTPKEFAKYSKTLIDAHRAGLMQ